MVLKSVWIKSQSSAHRQLTDYEKIDPDDILWLMQSKRKRHSCEQRMPFLRRGIDTGSCCFGELQGQARCFPAHRRIKRYAESRCCRLVLWQQCCVIQQLLINDNFSRELSQKHFCKWLVLVTASALILLQVLLLSTLNWSALPGGRQKVAEILCIATKHILVGNGTLEITGSLLVPYSP